MFRLEARLGPGSEPIYQHHSSSQSEDGTHVRSERTAVILCVNLMGVLLKICSVDSSLDLEIGCFYSSEFKSFCPITSCNIE